MFEHEKNHLTVPFMYLHCLMVRSLHFTAKSRLKHAKKAAEEHRSSWIYLALFTHLHHGNLFQII